MFARKIYFLSRNFLLHTEEKNTIPVCGFKTDQNPFTGPSYDPAVSWADLEVRGLEENIWEDQQPQSFQKNSKWRENCVQDTC